VTDDLRTRVEALLADPDLSESRFDAPSVNGVSVKRLRAVLDAVPDVPPTEDGLRDFLSEQAPGVTPDDLDHVMSALRVWLKPVVPPDPPAVDDLRSEMDAAVTDAVVAVTLRMVGEARARALRWAASFGTMPGLSWPETLRYHAEHGARYDRDEPNYDRAVSEREGDGK
jgi:hypothetical protein